MGDEDRLKELVELYGDKSGWATTTRKYVYHSGRNLMLYLGGFDNLCFASHEEIQRWIDAKKIGSGTAYNHKARICHIYDALVYEGVIDANPAKSVKVGIPDYSKARSKPAIDLKDIRKLFKEGERLSITLEGSKSYVVLCLKIRCGVKYSAMAKCKVSDLELNGDRGTLLAEDGHKCHRQIIYPLDKVTVDAIRNYFRLRGPYVKNDPLIAKAGYHGCEIGGHYKNSVLEQRVRILCQHIGINVGEYDLYKTVVMLAYAEGADILQATAIAVNDSHILAAKIAQELGSEDPEELRRRLWAGMDSEVPVATGMIRAEEIMKAVPLAYHVHSLKVVIGADGWAKIELPSND